MQVVPRRPHVPVVIRFPPELHAALTALAEREHRSLTAQVIHVMGQWVDQQEREERGRGSDRPATS